MINYLIKMQRLEKKVQQKKWKTDQNFVVAFSTFSKSKVCTYYAANWKVTQLVFWRLLSAFWMDTHWQIFTYQESQGIKLDFGLFLLLPEDVSYFHIYSTVNSGFKSALSHDITYFLIFVFCVSWYLKMLFFLLLLD